MSKPLIIFAGECNSCGYTPHRFLLPGELGKHQEVYIFNNRTEVIEPLDLCVNNNLEHANVDPGRSFGWEVFLVNQHKAGLWQPYERLYLLKVGQGGMKSGYWHDKNYPYYDILINRYKKVVEQLGDVNPIMWLQQGSNERNEPSEEANFKGNMWRFFDRLRTDIPGIPVLLPKQPPYSIALDPVCDLIAAGYDKVTAVNIYAANDHMQDEQHWNRTGMEIIANRLQTETMRYWRG